VHVLVFNDVAEVLDLFEATRGQEGDRVSRGTMLHVKFGRTFRQVTGYTGSEAPA